jgi:hypothetical protein
MVTWLIHGLFQPDAETEASAAVMDNDLLGDNVDVAAPDENSWGSFKKCSYLTSPYVL